MTVNKETASSTEFTVVFENNSNSRYIYGSYFLLEKKINGKWYQVPVVDDNYGFNDVGYHLASGDTGEYRIVKNISDFRGSADYDTFYLAGDLQFINRIKRAHSFAKYQ